MILDKLGGRKFALTLLCIGVAACIEILTERGLSSSMGLFLGGVVSAFCVTNMAVKRKLGVDRTSDLNAAVEENSAPLNELIIENQKAGEEYIKQLNNSLTEIRESQGAQAEQMNTILKAIKAALAIR